MRRSPLRRTPFRRKPKKAKVRVARLSTAQPQPPDWRKISLEIRIRDEGCCRRCGLKTMGLTLGAADHLIPRAWLSKKDVALRSNLAWLCAECHGKKLTVEAALEQGDVSGYELFLDPIEQSGPFPPPELFAQAYGRVARKVRQT